MDQKVPKHHVKQEICATRPVYREGRSPKAVKVYTVNNESKYILVQGVPAVGAMEELIKLCSSYGVVEEHQALDEYPCEDKYTEVYLIKYKKIQSARFAKRKLDEYSFFGGSLHICYAPEYESVQDTREKLQERRKAVAAKIRQHKSEQIDGKSSAQVTHNDNESERPQTPSHSTALTNYQNNDTHNHHPSQDLQQHSINNRLAHLDSHPSPQIHQESSAPFSLYETGEPSFLLPPPPVAILNSNQMKTSQKDYEYSRVPSKHATLPPGFDGRLANNPSIPSQSKPPPEPCNGNDLPHQTQSNTSKEPSKIINKNYKPSKPSLKFVPRQAIKRAAEDPALGGAKKSSVDDVDKEIRKNAFVLADQQGPKDLPGRQKDGPELPPGTATSYNNTIKSIRTKISKVITDTMKSQK